MDLKGGDVFMRSIKYRAFYKGEMRQVTALEWIHEGEDLAGCYLTGIDKCVIVNDDETTFGVDLLAFTGLHDRNGTEIYESDIVLFGDNAIHGGTHGKVIRLEDNRFVYEFVDGDYKGKCTDMLDSWRTYEVVGNVFENPGLLKGE